MSPLTIAWRSWRSRARRVASMATLARLKGRRAYVGAYRGSTHRPAGPTDPTRIARRSKLWESLAFSKRRIFRTTPLQACRRRARVLPAQSLRTLGSRSAAELPAGSGSVSGLPVVVSTGSGSVSGLPILCG